MTAFDPVQHEHKETFTCAKCKHKAIIITVSERYIILGKWTSRLVETKQNKPPKTCDCDCHVPWHFINQTKPEPKETVNV